MSDFDSLPHAAHGYQAFGLSIRSELILPALPPCTLVAPAEIEIKFGEVPADLADATVRGVRFQSAPDRTLLWVDRVARYLMKNGREVIIAPEPGADADDIRAFLLGAVFAALFRQRGELILQGSAVAVHGEGVVFLGRSGTGKSTAAAAFRARGHAGLTDDLCVLRPAPDGRMMIMPSFPQARLWPDSLTRLGLSLDDWPRLRPKLSKRVGSFADRFAAHPVPCKRIYALMPWNTPEFQFFPIPNPEKTLILRNQTYRIGYLADHEQKARHFGGVLALARDAALTRAFRPDAGFRLDELVQWIERDLETPAPTPRSLS